jgi:hypothetical protein
MDRRTALAALGSLFVPLRGSSRSDYLLITQSEIDAAQQKARQYDWAGAALRQLLARAETALSSPLNIPDRGGQWGHWYSCKKDGTPLVADSPTRHRCPKCGTIYTGEPYDGVAIASIHNTNSSAMRDMALAFRFTGRREFAEKVKLLLSGYGRRYLSYPRHDINGNDTANAGRITSQTLDESTWLIPVTWAYALIQDTLTERPRDQIASELLLPATDTIIGPSYEGLPNIQCWKNSAVGCVGFAIGNSNLISIALDNPIRGFRTLMSRYVMPGGLWSEGSLGYHHYALSALWPLAEAARAHGIDLYANESYRAMFDAPIALALPDQSVPDFNDNPSGPLPTWADVYELAFARWKRPEYGRVARLAPRNTVTALLYGAEFVPSGNPVPKCSIVMREAGFAVLRSSPASVAVRFGKHGGGHGHPDMLDVITFGAGRLFGVDPGSINYGVPLHHEWYRSTIAHNTVSVDEAVQSTADGEFLGWSSDGGRTSLKAEAQVYPGVTFRRDLRLQGATLADRFSCESQAEHVYDWAFHSYGVLKTSINLQPRTEPLGLRNGYQHIEQIRQGQTGADWTATWRNNGASLTLYVKGEPGTIVFTGVGPGRDPSERVPLVLIRRRGITTTFDIKHSFVE